MSRRNIPVAVKLPRSHGIRKITKHPIFLPIDAGIARAELARRIGIRRHSIITGELAAESNRDYLMPATWVRTYSEATGLPPYVFRPDLFDRSWVYPKVSVR